MAQFWDFPSQSWLPCYIVGWERDPETGYDRALTIRVGGRVKRVHPGSVQGDSYGYTSLSPQRQQVGGVLQGG